MNWRCFLSALLLPLVFASVKADGDAPLFAIQNEPVPAPAGARVIDPRFSRSPDDLIHLAWIELADEAPALRFSTWQPGRHAWAPPRTIAPLPPGAAYAFAAGPDGRLAVLVASRTALLLLTSSDHGDTWTPPSPLALPGNRSPRLPALLFLPDTRLLAAWLDEPGGEPASLDTAILDGQGQPRLHRVESPVSRGSAPALAAFPDGSALLAWRGLTTNKVQDIRTARFEDDGWQPARPLSPDAWSPPAPPADGPSLDGRGAHLAAAWFTAADGPRVHVSTSSSAGIQWLMPARVDDIAPLGRPSLVMLDDGATLVSWVERDDSVESVFLRRLSPRGTLGAPVRLARAVTGHPQLVRVRDGGATPAQLLLAALSDGGLVTHVVTLPDASLLAEADACDCDPRPEAERGYALKGRIVSIDRDASTLTLAHTGIPGVMKPAATAFKTGPDTLAAAQAGRDAFAHAERIGPDWWLFNLRLTGTSPHAGD